MDLMNRHRLATDIFLRLIFDRRYNDKPYEDLAERAVSAAKALDIAIGNDYESDRIAINLAGEKPTVWRVERAGEDSPGAEGSDARHSELEDVQADTKPDGNSGDGGEQD